MRQKKIRLSFTQDELLDLRNALDLCVKLAAIKGEFNVFIIFSELRDKLGYD